MILTGVWLENWLCYRGVSELALQPLAYAVVARREDDGDASNWNGKSALLEAVRFALSGTHRHQPSADAWITRGCDRGGVVLAFDEGTVVSRKREPGKSTQLEVVVPGHGKAKQDEAQALLWRRVGMTEQDVMTCSYLEQGATDAFVTADPGPRTAMVVGWLRLEPLQRAHKSVGEELSGVERELAGVNARATVARERLAAAMAGVTDAQTEAQRQADIDQWTHELAERVRLSDEVVEEATERAANAGMAALYDGKREELEGVVRSGKRTKLVLDATDPARLRAEQETAVRENKAAQAALVEAAGKLRARRSVAKGTFDGCCPVAGIDCPVKADINRMAEHGKAESKEAAEEYAVASSRAGAAQDELRRADGKVADYERLRGQLVELGARSKALKKTLEGQVETRVSTQGPTLLEAQQASIAARREQQDFLQRLGTAAKEQAELEKAEGEAAGLGKRTATLREAQAILGRSGAQRRLAEGALGSIEGEANAVLDGCQVGLELKLTWEREGKAAADECPRCGRAFAASVREKVCQECGEARGKNMVQRLDVNLSRVSGAANALGGLSTAFGAAQWLRQERSSPWALAMLDEPLSSCDKRNRRLVGGQLGAMLGLAGFRQALVVSHDPQAVAALPGRILVTGMADGHSRVEVVG